MKVGDLVTIKPARGSFCIITSINVFGLPSCVEVWYPEPNMILPMEKRWIEVVSKSD